MIKVYQIVDFIYKTVTWITSSPWRPQVALEMAETTSYGALEVPSSRERATSARVEAIAIKLEDVGGHRY